MTILNIPYYPVQLQRILAIPKDRQADKLLCCATDIVAGIQYGTYFHVGNGTISRKELTFKSLYQSIFHSLLNSSNMKQGSSSSITREQA